MNPSDQARQVGVVDSWLAQYRSSSELVNPEANVLVCDTGQLPAGYYDVFYLMGSSVALAGIKMRFSWCNAANDLVLWSDWLQTAGAASVHGFLLGVKVVANERFKVLTEAAITGMVNGAVLAVRRA